MEALETPDTNARTEIKVLLVEDDQADVFVFHNMVQIFNDEYPVVKVGVCRSIKEAEAALEEGKYDLVLLDLTLSDSAGLEGLRRLLSLYPEIPIVVHSGVYSKRYACEAIALGAQDYIVKGTMQKEDFVRALLHAKIRFDTMKRLHQCAVVNEKR